MKKQDILMVGVGGQGTVLASDILGEAALASGYDVKKTDTLGMAQRGGSVVSHVRIGQQIYSPLLHEGEVDLLVAFEKLEAARWGHYLSPGGVAIVNNLARPPLSVSLGTFRYPSDDEVKKVLKQRTERFCFINGTARSEKLGDVRTLNLFMLGCASHFLPLKVGVWRECISRHLPQKIVEINMAAFEQGRKEISSVNL